jgi:antibiotic biosynthesis monooxygenase (ABM) superfamily enzyme
MATDTIPTTPASTVAPGAASAAPAAAPIAPPSVHVRAAITWLAIFPLVAIGMMLMAPFTESWHPVLRALVLTLVVVPLAVYLVVPRMMRTYAGLRRRAPRSGVDA